MAGDAKIGSLLLLLEANTAKLDEQIKQSKSHLDSFKSSTDALKNALLGFGAIEVFKSIIDKTAEAEKAQALLTSQLKATGDASGYTVDQLTGMADAFQESTTFSHVQVETLQASLLAFTNITGEQFKRTTQAVLDFATVTGRDPVESARTLAMAINDPISGLGRLRQAGVDLTKAQQDQIKAMAESGDMIGAQNRLLDLLQHSYGGAAAAARDTLGGALQGLHNDFNDLLEGKGGTVGNLTDSIKELDKTINSPDIKQGFASLVAGIAQTGTWIAKATASISDFATGLAVAAGAIDTFGGQGDAIQDIGNKLGAARNELAAYQNDLVRMKAGLGNEDGLTSVDQINAKINQQKLLVQQLQAAWDTLLRNGANATPKQGPKTFTAGTPDELKAGDLGSLQRIDSFQELNPGRSGGLITQTDQLKQDQQKVLEIWKQNDPSAYLQKQIDETEALVGTVVNGEIFTSDDATKHINDMRAQAESAKTQMDAAETQMTEFTKQAARNMQDEFANALFQPMHNGIRGMLEDWGKALEKMADQIVAADLMNKLFGGYDKSGNGQAGFSNMLGSFFSHFFGSSTTPSTGSGHADGGDVSAGTMYPVNELGSELYTTASGSQFLLPGSDGTITPSSALGGGSTHINIDARGAGPVETAQLLALESRLVNTVQSMTEHRLQRGGWPTLKAQR